jgi:hypothetical protein
MHIGRNTDPTYNGEMDFFRTPGLPKTIWVGISLVRLIQDWSVKIKSFIEW